ncbi:three-Cys-motif partner protein TcmP [Prescottella equi]|nr:three-Cys-motif partner protein TcmP [Prescottella equi]
MSAGRGWGPWSRIKLEALEDYLAAFTRASSSTKTLYLDLFAGASQNFERGTGDVIRSSGHRALSVSPHFSRVVLCEMQQTTAANLEMELRAQYPGRSLEVLRGDCNVEIPGYLKTLSIDWPRYAAVFAMVDQFSAEISWDTLEYLSRFRRNKRGFKVELWLYFGHGLLPRGLGLGDEPDKAAVKRVQEYADRIDRMYGTAQWRELWRAREAGSLSGASFRGELVNLMRWRLERVLGYKTTLPLEFTNENGNPIYTVIFATSNDTGAHIMNSVFSKHGVALANMRNMSKAAKRLEREEDAGEFSLFGAEEIGTLMTCTTVREPLMPPVEPYRFP